MVVVVVVVVVVFKECLLFFSAQNFWLSQRIKNFSPLSFFFVHFLLSEILVPGCVLPNAEEEFDFEGKKIPSEEIGEN